MKPFALFLTLSIGGLALAQNTCQVPRAFPSCTLLYGCNIYCFGGFASRNNQFNLDGFTNTGVMMPLIGYNFNNVTMNWQTIGVPSFVTAEMASAAVNGSNSVFLYGGLSSTATDAGIVFAPGTWTLTHEPAPYSPIDATFQTYGTQTFQVADSTVVYIPGIDTAWTWGGRLARNVLPNGGSIGASERVLYWGNISASQPSWYTLNTAPTPYSYVRASHTATIDPSGIIHVIGGQIFTQLGAQIDVNNPIQHLWNIWTFDTNTHQWNETIASYNQSSPPSSRMAHTTTYLPNADCFLIFGGLPPTNQLFSSNVSDLAYYYFYRNQSLQQINIWNSQDSPVELFSHAAVPYQTGTGESYLFILFGQDSTGQPRNAGQILNVTNPFNVSWLPQGGANYAHSNETSSPGLSSSAVIGISVGTTLFGIGVGCAVIFYYYRRKKRQQDFHLQESDPRLGPDDVFQPLHYEMAQSTTQTGSTPSERPYSPSSDSYPPVKPYSAPLVTKPYEQQ
ncbi:hypothetical protein BC940DRAFT_291249 [Gongronella butleri]|nr:hypothetical protein BC940DRAFT_291249 [Gongronella butleri]